MRKQLDVSRLPWRLTTAACGLWLCVVLAVNAQEPRTDEVLVAKVDRLVASIGIKSDGPGLAILIRQPGRVRFAKGYGLANLEDRTPVTSTTLFELASASKPITATAVLMLHDRGLLSLDDDIRKHLPELPDYQTGRPIRVRDLLYHISGLPDYMAIADLPARNGTYWTNDDYLPEFARQKDAYPQRFKPGEKYEYNNTNYMLAASLVQRVSKNPFAVFMRDEVFLPAGMTSTFVCDSPTATPKPGAVAALGYVKQGNRWEPSWGAPPQRHEELLTAGDGAIWSNLEDFARWDTAVREGKLVKRPTLRQALTPSVTSDGNTNAYGLGWTLYYNGDQLSGVGHDGMWGGFQTSYYFDVAKKRTTIILANHAAYGGDKFWYDLDGLVDRYLAQRRTR
jgi:CubicO group peptidase (beta-lactamase class C family)